MSRLFVAVPLPATVVAELASIQPPPTPGLRWVQPDQMHLTLHYIGEVDEDRAARMSDALRSVPLSEVSLTIAGVGQFPSAGGDTTLWAGVRESSELRQLHAAVAAALAGEGFKPKARGYTPHITLARCRPEVPASLVTAFLSRHQDFTLAAVPITGFALYSSSRQGDLPVYQRERLYPLT